MSLTQDDLLAIKNIVETAVDDSDQRTAAGFAEVHEKFAEVHERIDGVAGELNGVKADLSGVKADLSGVKTDLSEVKSSVERIEMRQQADTERLDEHGKDIALLKSKLKLA